MHRYALEIGWPVPLLKKLMSSRDIAEAMAFERLQPLSETRADYRHAILCSVIASSSGAKKVKLEDFIPKFNEDRKESALVRDIKEAFKIGNAG